MLLRKSKLECRIVARYFPDFLLYRDSLIYEDVTGGFFALKDTQINNDLSGRFSKYFNVFNIQENLTLQARLYLGSILFGKFIPPKYHPKGGINHVEYRFENETIVNSSLYESRKISRK